MPQYAPGPVPQDVRGMPAFLNNEFERIANVLNGAVKLSYGGLFQAASPVNQVLGVAPVTFNTFDTLLPGLAEPQGTLPEIATGEITILTGGIYAVNFTTTNSAVPINSAYEFVLARNGVAGPVGGSVDPSNQTDFITLTFGGIVRYDRGDVASVLADSATSDDWLSQYAQFMVYRISDSSD